jgi:DeoR family fructose operon transcriptional repressor
MLDMLRNQPGLRIPELAQSLGVSEGTVRNDLNALEDEGQLKRVHGGAVLTYQDIFQSNSFLRRYKVDIAAKSAIAAAASQLVRDGDSILLDASTSVYYLGRALSDRNKLRVVTNGFEVARAMAQNASNTVILIGGVVNHDLYSVTGVIGEKNIAEMRIDKAFFSSSGFSLERGMTDVHMVEAQWKSKAIDSVREVFAMVDSSKFGKEDLTPFCAVNQITHLYTDSGITDDWVSRLKDAHVHFTICE